MEIPADRDEMCAKLKRNRERILLAMFRHGDLKSREIREQTGLSRGSKNHHFNVLQEWGLIEEVDRDESSGGPYPERVFGLTDEGREFTDEYLTEQGERPDSYELRVQRLEDEVDDLKTANERLQDEVERLQEEKADREKISEQLQGKYWESLKNEIARQIGEHIKMSRKR